MYFLNFTYSVFLALKFYLFILFFMETEYLLMGLYLEMATLGMGLSFSAEG